MVCAKQIFEFISYFFDDHFVITTISIPADRSATRMLPKIPEALPRELTTTATTRASGSTRSVRSAKNWATLQSPRISRNIRRSTRVTLAMSARSSESGCRRAGASLRDIWEIQQILGEERTRERSRDADKITLKQNFTCENPINYSHGEVF